MTIDSASAAPSVRRPASPVNPSAVLAVVAVAQFMVILDASVVNVALPTIKGDLGFSEQSLSWILNAYALVFGGFLLLAGRVADRLGRCRLFMAGTTVFTAASLMVGLVLLPLRKRVVKDEQVELAATSFAGCPGAPYAGHLARVVGGMK